MPEKNYHCRRWKITLLGIKKNLEKAFIRLENQVVFARGFYTISQRDLLEIKSSNEIYYEFEIFLKFETKKNKKNVINLFPRNETLILVTLEKQLQEKEFNKKINTCQFESNSKVMSIGDFETIQIKRNKTRKANQIAKLETAAAAATFADHPLIADNMMSHFKLIDSAMAVADAVSLMPEEIRLSQDKTLVKVNLFK